MDQRKISSYYKWNRNNYNPSASYFSADLNQNPIWDDTEDKSEMLSIHSYFINNRNLNSQFLNNSTTWSHRNRISKRSLIKQL